MTTFDRTWDDDPDSPVYWTSAIIESGEKALANPDLHWTLRPRIQEAVDSAHATRRKWGRDI